MDKENGKEDNNSTEEHLERIWKIKCRWMRGIWPNYLNLLDACRAGWWRKHMHLYCRILDTLRYIWRQEWSRIAKDRLSEHLIELSRPSIGPVHLWPEEWGSLNQRSSGLGHAQAQLRGQWRALPKGELTGAILHAEPSVIPLPES